jgi:alanyl-tRNA synthetase
MASNASLEWPVSRVRDTFVNHFVQKYGHTHVPSSATIPYADPTLLFANSGMVQVRIWNRNISFDRDSKV